MSSNRGSDTSFLGDGASLVLLHRILGLVLPFVWLTLT